MIDIVIMLLALWVTNGQMQDVSSDLGMSSPLAPAGRPSRLKRGYQRLCNKASTLNPWRKVILGLFCTLLFVLFATLQLSGSAAQLGHFLPAAAMTTSCLALTHCKTCSCKTS